MKHLRDKVAAITGAGAGIGRALAIELANRQCHLALSDVDEDNLAETARLAAASSDVRITTRVVDVAKRAPMQTWANRVANEHGAVHLIFNNAGVALGSTIEGANYADLKWITDINYWGVVHGTKAFLPYLRQSGEGHIVNTSSAFGLIGVPTQSAYNATKFAVRGFTDALRQELAVDGGTVSASCVYPGGIQTGIARTARLTESMLAFTGRTLEESQAHFETMCKTTPEAAARTILRGVKRDAARILIGPDARAIDWLARLAPGTYQRLVAFGVKRMNG